MSEMLSVSKTVLPAGDSRINITNENIEDDSIIDIYTSNPSITYTSMSLVDQTVTLEFQPLEDELEIAMLVNNCTDFSPYDDTEIRQALNGIAGVVDDLEDDKQDKLTAGNNITIENNVISASGGGGAGEVYNTNEDVVIGTYNGKPLYRHYVTGFTISGTHSSEGWFAHGVENIETIVDHVFWCNDWQSGTFGSQWWFFSVFRVNSTHIGYFNYGIVGNLYGWFLYTKVGE